jgi:hypothetical protein
LPIKSLKNTFFLHFVLSISFYKDKNRFTHMFKKIDNF